MNNKMENQTHPKKPQLVSMEWLYGMINSLPVIKTRIVSVRMDMQGYAK